MPKKPSSKRKLTEAISLRLAPEDKAKLDLLAERLPIPALTIARVALRLGLDALLEDPTLLLIQSIEKRGGSHSRPRKKR